MKNAAEHEAFRLQTAQELMKLLEGAEATAKFDPAFGEYAMDLCRLRNRLSLQIKNTLQVINER